MKSEPPSGDARLFALLCTFRREGAVRRYLDSLERQTRPPDVVVVVDNGADPALEREIATRTTLRPACRYLSTGSNIGPAGAFKAGFDAIACELGDADLCLYCDDDDPPVDEQAIARLVALLRCARQGDGRIAGVGLSGGKLDPRLGLVRGVSDREDLSEADHLHGGYLPIYLGAAIKDVGGNDPTYFYGFEELEFGRRLALAGWRLRVAASLMRSYAARYPKRQGRRSREPAWSRFHKERNLIRILRRERLWGAIGLTIAGRHVLRPLLAFPRRPRASWGRLRLGIAAAVAGLKGEGGIDGRYPPEPPRDGPRRDAVPL